MPTPSEPSSSSEVSQDSATVGRRVLDQSKLCPPVPMDDMVETIEKVDEMLDRIETRFPAYMSRLLKNTRKYLTEDSVKAVFECAICQETIIQTGFMRCKHLFCDFCLTKWHESNINCPVCRNKDTGMADKNKLIDGVIDVFVELSFSDEQKMERDKVIQQRRTDEASESSDYDPTETSEIGSSVDPALWARFEIACSHFRRNQRISLVNRAIALFEDLRREISKYSTREELMGPEKVKPDDESESPQDVPSFSDLADTFNCENLEIFASVSDSYESEYRSRLSAVNSSNSYVRMIFNRGV